jgi:hypothetical protein
MSFVGTQTTEKTKNMASTNTTHYIAKATLSHNGQGSAQPITGFPIEYPLQPDSTSQTDKGKVRAFSIKGLIPKDATKLEVMLKDVVNQFYNTNKDVTIRIVLR